DRRGQLGDRRGGVRPQRQSRVGIESHRRRDPFQAGPSSRTGDAAAGTGPRAIGPTQGGQRLIRVFSPTMTGIRSRPGKFGRDPTSPRSGENSAAALLLLFTVIAIVWANSPWAESYWAFWNTDLGISFGQRHAELTVKHLVNDRLMAFFFFIVGLEVASQFRIGELTDRARAVVPVLAA